MCRYHLIVVVVVSIIWYSRACGGVEFFCVWQIFAIAARIPTPPLYSCSTSTVAFILHVFRCRYVHTQWMYARAREQHMQQNEQRELTGGPTDTLYMGHGESRVHVPHILFSHFMRTSKHNYAHASQPENRASTRILFQPIFFFFFSFFIACAVSSSFLRHEKRKELKKNTHTTQKKNWGENDGRALKKINFL